MKPEIKVDEKPMATAPVVLENSPKDVGNVDILVSAKSIIIRKNRQTSLSKGVKLIIILSLAAMTIWLVVWIGSKCMARTRVMPHKVRTQLVLKGQTCGWVEFNEPSRDVLFTVKTMRFRGIIVDCYSKNVEVIIPTNTAVCYVLLTTNLTFNDNKALVPYLQERGFHKFVVIGEMVSDFDLCEVSRDLCRGLKLMMIRPTAGRVKKSLFGFEEKNDDDDDVVEIFLL